MFLITWKYLLFVIAFLKCVFCNGNNNSSTKGCDRNVFVDLYKEVLDEHEKQQHLLEQLKQNVKGASCKPACPDLTTIKKEHQLPKTCADVIQPSDLEGIYSLYVPGFDTSPFKAYCIPDYEHQGPAWTVIFRRSNMGINFKRSREEYKYGFGSIYGDHFLGLSAIHAMTNSQRHELWIKVYNTATSRNARYSNFVVDNEENNWMLLTLGNFTDDGHTQDCFSKHISDSFSTTDNDLSQNACTKSFNAGWFHEKSKSSKCASCNLFAKPNKKQGIFWNEGVSEEEYEYGHMMIRPFQ